MNHLNRIKILCMMEAIDWISINFKMKIFMWWLSFFTTFLVKLKYLKGKKFLQLLSLQLWKLILGFSHNFKQQFLIKFFCLIEILNECWKILFIFDVDIETIFVDFKNVKNRVSEWESKVGARLKQIFVAQRCPFVHFQHL